MARRSSFGRGVCWTVVWVALVLALFNVATQNALTSHLELWAFTRPPTTKTFKSDSEPAEGFAVQPLAARKLHFPCQAHPQTCEGKCAQVLNTLKERRTSMGWDGYYGEVTQLLKDLKSDRGIFVEVGTAFGGLAATLLEALPEIQYHAVDPFLANYDGNDGMSLLYQQLGNEGNMTVEELSQLWAQAMAFDLGGKYGCRYFQHHALSTVATSKFPPYFTDVAFIDGLHTFDGVVADMKAFTSKVIPNGLMLFNDYGFAPEVFGVAPAVRLFTDAWYQKPVAFGSPQFNNVYIVVPDFTKSSLRAKQPLP